MNLSQRFSGYAQYPFLRRWYLRARITFLHARCLVGWHSDMRGYTGRVWCWVCGRQP